VLYGQGPSNAGDGNLQTYWWANTEVSWLQVVLPSSRYLQRFEIHGYTGYYLAAFAVKLSQDGSTWTTIYQGGSTVLVDHGDGFRAMWARYIRLEVSDIYQCCGAFNNFAVIREIEFFETANVASWRPGSSSGNRWGHLPFEAVDGNLATYWWGTSSYGSWIRYDFPATCMFMFRLQMYPGYGVLAMQVHVFEGTHEWIIGYGFGIPALDILGGGAIPLCGVYAFRITFFDTSQGAYDDFPVVRELEVYYGE